ncbi:hypothetical protein MMC30_007903 [Trapelia coarctata]|nr:hypothetical protein [Trapelia coarctata]
MSGRAGVRSSSRRNTPQSPPQARNADAPEPSRRTLRSQSREVSDGESGLQSTLGSTRTKPIGRGGGRGGRRTKQAVRSGPQHGRLSRSKIALITVDVFADLSAVVEEPNDTAFEREEDLDAANARRSLSAISGTTARTSHSAQELSDLRAEDMLNALPDLADASDKVLKVVLLHKVAGVSDERVETRIRTLQSPTSTASNNLSRQLPGYREQKAVYGNELYINLSIALRAMLGVRRPAEVGTGPWRPDDVLYKANLANLAIDVLALRANVKQLFVEKMERDFPAPFLSQVSSIRQSSHSAGVSLLVRETFEAAFSLRVQMFLSMVNQRIHEPNFDPDKMLGQVFYDGDIYNGDTNLKGWEIRGLRTADLSKQQRKEAANRLDTIRTHFREGHLNSFDEVVDIQALEVNFPWSECVMKLLLWARQRANEIETHLASLGGVDGLQEALEAELQNRKDMGAKSTEEVGGDTGLVVLDFIPSEVSHRPSEQIEPMKNATSTTSRATRTSLMYSTPSAVSTTRKKLAAVRLANQREGVQPSPLNSNPASTIVSSSDTKRTQTTRSNGLQAPTTLPAQVLEGVASEDDPEEYDLPQVNDNEPYGHSGPDVTSAEIRLRILQTQNKTLAEQDKENRPQDESAFASPQNKRSFVDRQPNAQKVSFESQPSTQTGSSASRAKRARPDDVYESNGNHMSDPSEEDSFQTQDQPRVSRPNQATGTKRTSSTAASRPLPKRTRLTQERERSVTLESDFQAAVNDPNGQPPLSQIQIYNAARTQSKIATVQHGQKRGQKRVQRRTPWTDEETETLQELIGTEGVSWSLLKSIDQKSGKILANRDQVALKDKARNMYIDYLKSGIAIPPNFEHIPLKMADKIKLRDHYQIDLFALEENDDEDGD